MPNFASLLKEEISRIARKEVRAETEGLKKASASYRSEIAALKRRIADLERQLARAARAAERTPVTPVSDDSPQQHRFSAKGLVSLRKRLDLSAPELARILQVSTQTVYNWEAGTTRPRRNQIASIAEVRSIGKRELRARLATLEQEPAAA